MKLDLFGQSPDDDEDGAEAGPGQGKPVPLEHQPLAERMRPRNFGEWIGQQEVTGPGSPLRRFLSQGALPSLIFWGPPGCGKTTLARIIAAETGLAFQPLSAVTSGIKDVKEVIERARGRLVRGRGKTILFIDEIHRFNKAQQDAFLPHVENGTIVLIGATTENPSFSIIAPLLSRCRILTLTALTIENLVALLRRTLADGERGLGSESWEADEVVLERIAQLSDGDARRALNTLEQCATAARAGEAPSAGAAAPEAGETTAPPAGRRLTLDLLARVLERDHLLYDRAGEEHYNLISALHKSMRSSEPQAAVYWLARMLAAGEEPLYVARRIVRFAAEDVGLADPQALTVCLAALQTYQQLGSPEGELAIAEAAVYCAVAPKSNSIYKALDAAMDAVKEHGALPVPLHLRNAPTGLMKSLGYGREYQYDHNAPDHFSGQPCLPEALAGAVYYAPGIFGFEKEIQRRLEWWEKKRREREADAPRDKA
ncbi:MAG: replication-associated recombination protein A [bacterium]|nr:replication-associated recombination protein A [bacterium]